MTGGEPKRDWSAPMFTAEQIAAEAQEQHRGRRRVVARTGAAAAAAVVAVAGVGVWAGEQVGHPTPARRYHHRCGDGGTGDPVHHLRAAGTADRAASAEHCAGDDHQSRHQHSHGDRHRQGPAEQRTRRHHHHHQENHFGRRARRGGYAHTDRARADQGNPMRRIRGGRADDAGAELNMTPFRRPSAPEPAPSPAVPDEDADVGISGDPSAQPVGRQPVEPVRRWQSFGGGGRSAAAAAPQWQEPTPVVDPDLAVVDLVRPPPNRYVIPPAPTRTPMAAPSPSTSTVVPAVAPVAVRTPRTLPRGFASRNAAAVAGWAADPNVGVRPVVFSAGGGVGVSTVVAAVGGFLASVSVSPVLAVESTRRPWSSLTRLVTGDTRGMSVEAWQDLRSGGHDLDSALSMAPGGASGLRVLHEGGGELERLTGQLPAAASVIIDAGSLDNPDLAALLSTWPVAVLVVRADPAGVDAALVTVGHLRASLPAGLDVLMVLSDCGAFGGATVRAAAKLAGSVGEVLTLPNSAGLREQPIRVDRLDKPVAAVIADITHSVVDRSWRRGNPRPAGRPPHLPPATTSAVRPQQFPQ